MDVKAFPALIVGVVVALVLAGAVLPVFAETTSATDTFKNEGYFRMAETEITGADTITVSWDYTKPTIINVEGVDYEIVLSSGSSRTVAFCDNCLLRLFRHTDVKYSFEVWYAGVKSAYTNDSVSATAVIDSQKVTWTPTDSTATTITATGKWCIINDTGAYVMKDATTPAYMLKDSTFRIAGVSSIGAPGNSRSSSFFVSSGTVDDFTVTTPGVATVSNENATYTDISNYVDLISLEKITFTTTWTPESEPIVNNQIYTYFAVPYEVTAEKTVHPDGSLTVMLNVLPLLAIAGLVTGAVVWFINRKG